ncbi:MAG: hypothetical protein ACLQVD_12790 [Capsulimonadaceae bacterium]
MAGHKPQDVSVGTTNTNSVGPAGSPRGAAAGTSAVAAPDLTFSLI